MELMGEREWRRVVRKSIILQAQRLNRKRKEGARTCNRADGSRHACVKKDSSIDGLEASQLSARGRVRSGHSEGAS